HDAGTGPFMMTEFDLGTKYMVKRFDGYWGPKPQVTSITYNILPDISTQRLKLESGELSMIIHGLTVDDVKSFEGNPGFQVQRFPALFKTFVMVNPNKDAFKDKAARQAVVAAIDKDKITKEVYGDNGSVSKQLYPAGELPDGLAMEAKTDKSKLQAMAGQFSGKTIDIGYSSDDPRNQRVADLVQTDLPAPRLTPTPRRVPPA